MPSTPPKGRGMGRKIPKDFAHVTRNRVRTLFDDTVATVEKTLDVPLQYVPWYDQGAVGACTGFSGSWMMSILNRRKYVAMKLYGRAQEIDEFPETPPEEGSSVYAMTQVLLTEGHWRFFRGIEKLIGFNEGIAAVRWATTVDELRTIVAKGVPFVLGINWYEEFFSPQYVRTTKGINEGEWWIGKNPWGSVAGGHAICGFAASDRRQAFRLVNTWGHDYPRPWISYDSVQRLIDEQGEAAVVTDR